MCGECGIKTSVVVGSVVKNVRRCEKRPIKDRGASIVGRLLYVTKNTSRGENEATGELQKLWLILEIVSLN